MAVSHVRDFELYMLIDGSYFGRGRPWAHQPLLRPMALEHAPVVLSCAPEDIASGGDDSSRESSDMSDEGDESDGLESGLDDGARSDDAACVAYGAL